MALWPIWNVYGATENQMFHHILKETTNNSSCEVVVSSLVPGMSELFPRRVSCVLKQTESSKQQNFQGFELYLQFLREKQSWS